MKDKNQIVISTDAEKALDKIQHPFMIFKIHIKVGIEGIYFNIIKTFYDKATVNIMHSGKKKKKKRKIFVKNQEQDKGAHLCHFYLT